MSLDNTLLKIRREYSGNEKYRLFLKHLDNVESELQKERAKATDKIKENLELQQKNKELRVRNHELEGEIDRLKGELGEYTATETDKKFVRMKAYRKLDQVKTMWETRFWEVHRQLEELKQSIHSGNESL